MNFELARENMIEQQIRTWEVLDQQVLDLLAEIHREDFIPDVYKDLALSDTRIPLEHDQVTMMPKEEARIIQSLNLTSEENVLEIGTGCGYMTALLARRSAHVHSIDIFPSFTDSARTKLLAYGLDNVSLYSGDGLLGRPDSAPYDVIVLTGSLPDVNDTLLQQLIIGGRLFAITGESPVMDATLITKLGEKDLSREIIFETDLPALIGGEPVPVFEF
jgi:protein-L-isoaspartate(D-aspartate) O-methyltransferase